MDALREFLELIEVAEPRPMEELLRRVLLKSRQITGAEAGTIFTVRGRGRRARLEAINVQNDVVTAPSGDETGDGQSGTCEECGDDEDRETGASHVT